MMRCGILRFCVAAVAAVAFSAAFAPDLLAATRLVTPEMFKPSKNFANEYWQTPSGILGGATLQGRLWAPVKLPVGKRVTGLVYEHQGGYGPVSTEVILYRVKAGEDVEKMAFAGDTTGGGVVIPVATSDISYAKIQPGYRYYVEATLLNQISGIHWVKVLFK